MTLTIELTPAEKARLEAAARNRGVDPGELARQLIANLPAIPETTNGQAGAGTERDPELVERVKSLRGKYAHLGVTTEDLHRERQQDEAKEGPPVQGRKP